MMTSSFLRLLVSFLLASHSVVSQSPSDEMVLSSRDPYEKTGTTFEIFAMGDKEPQEPSPAAVQETIVPTTTGTYEQFTSAPTTAPPEPFNFTHIFLIGDDCTSSTIWYSKWIAAGVATLDRDDQVQVICATQEDIDKGLGVYTREFHLMALKRVEEIAGDQLNETLVITVAVGLESDWTPVADLLRRGMAFFHAKEDAHNFNITDYGLSPENILYFYFQWNEQSVATQTGQELCRIKKGAPSLKVAELWTHGRNGSLNYRTTMAIDAFQEACPETELIRVWSLYTDQTAAYETTLQFNPVPDVILCTQDDIAANIMEVAQKALPDDYRKISTTGWNNNEDFRHLVAQRKILTTVDQVVLYPNRGVWKVINTVVQLIQKTGLRTTKAVQKQLSLGDGLTIKSDTLLVSSDQVGYLHDSLLIGYDNGAAPAKEVLVSTGLHNVTVTKMAPFEAKFEAVIWTRMSWKDPRLEFDPTILSDSQLPMDAADIWVPALFFQNEVRHFELYTAPAMVSYDGTVELHIHTMNYFLCATTNDLRSFPFDEYDCAIELGAPQMLKLDASFGFDLVETDPHFDTSTSVDLDPGGHVVYYGLRFERKPFTAYVRLIIPAILINLVGFMAFWIPTAQESVALGITAFLCSLAFRETIELPETSDITWSEVFMMVNIFYQASVLFIIWCSYTTNNPLSRALDNCCRKIHPHRVHKGVKKGVKTSVKSTRQMALVLADQEIRFFRSSELNSSGKRMGNDSMGSTSSERARLFEASNNGSLSDAVLVQGDVLHVGRDKRGSLVLIPEKAGSIASASGHSHTIGAGSTHSKSLFPIGSGHSLHRLFDQSSDSDSDDVASFADPTEKHTNTRNDDSHSKNVHFETATEKPKRQSRQRRISFMVMDKDDEDEGASVATMRDQFAKSKGGGDEDDEEDKDTPISAEEHETNVDWIGRWFIVPSYVVVMFTLIFGGWGFKG